MPKDTDEALLQRYLERIQLEIQRFQAKIAQNTQDPDHFMTLMEMESVMSEFRHATQRIWIRLEKKTRVGKTLLDAHLAGFLRTQDGHRGIAG